MNTTARSMISLQDSVLSIPWWQYWGLAILLSAIVRVVLIFFRCYRLTHEDEKGFATFWIYFARLYFLGLGYKAIDRNSKEDERERVRGDYGTAYVLGILELAVFPFLFAAKLDAYIGAWIGLKVVAQYKHWTEDRGSFTTFLVGNALVLIFAFVFLQGYISRSA